MMTAFSRTGVKYCPSSGKVKIYDNKVGQAFQSVFYILLEGIFKTKTGDYSGKHSGFCGDR